MTEPMDQSGEETVPADIRLLLGAAATQHVADSIGVRILHIKGFAAREFDGARSYADVDIMVDPAQEDRLLAAMSEATWTVGAARVQRGHTSHATDVLSHAFGVKVDVHEHFPGITLSPQTAFDILWRNARTQELAGRTVRVPGRVDNALILALHGVRCQVGSRGATEGLTVWTNLSDTDRQRFIALAKDLRAESVLGVRIERFAHYTTARDRALYSVVGQDRSRLELWTARIRHQETLLGRVRLTLGMLVPRTDWDNPHARRPSVVAAHIWRTLQLTVHDLRARRRSRR